MLRCEVAKDQRHGGHVLQTVIPVGRIGQSALFGNDADGGFVGGDDDAVDVVQAVFDLWMQGYRSFWSALVVMGLGSLWLPPHFSSLAGAMSVWAKTA
jgi:hypothetical protein